MICFCKNAMKKININGILFYECPHCGFMSKSIVLSSDCEKKRYDQHVCDDGYLKYMNKVYINIKDYIKEGISLDFGCGQIHALSDILNANNYKCDYYDLYYFNNDNKNKVYDNIILIEVFEHIKDIYNLLLDLKMHLNQNGRIIIMTKKKPANLNNWWYLRDITHISFIEDKTMEHLAKLLNMKLDIISDRSLFIFTSIE